MPLATEIYQEGLRVPPVRIMARGQLVADVLRLFTANTRVADERRGDLLAQLAALRRGAMRLRDLTREAGRTLTTIGMLALQDYSARLLSASLRRLPAGTYVGEDWMDDDGAGTVRIPIRVAVRIARGQAVVDFTGTSQQVPGGINANYAVTMAAVLYTFQSLADTPIPPNAGLMRPLRIVAPLGTLVNPRFPAAVAGGNVETSQRIVDVLLKALARAAPGLVPAASGGSMNNLALGGYDPIRRREFAYYETIAGGAGGGPRCPGASGRHTHMTNTLNTPVEALEAAYPLRVARYGIRRGSGGKGRHRGGDGIVRELEFLTPTRATLLTDRRRFPAYGLHGGSPGQLGRNVLVNQRKTTVLAGKLSLDLPAGARLRILTPGGGGWGRRR
jgi:N-methylhydantoinase B/oxoprolinase/acetone carboxylase alpha subunit